MFLCNLCQNTLHKSSLDDNNSTYMHACIHSVSTNLLCFHIQLQFSLSHLENSPAHIVSQLEQKFCNNVQFLTCRFSAVSVSVSVYITGRTSHRRLIITLVAGFCIKCDGTIDTQFGMLVYLTAYKSELKSIAACPFARPHTTRSPANCDCSNKVTITQRPN